MINILWILLWYKTKHRIKTMNIFLDYCIYRFKTPAETPKNVSPHHSPIQSCLGTRLRQKKCCANFSCNEFEHDKSKWTVKVIHNKRPHYFCSFACKNDWLNDPSQIGSWSPPLIAQEPNEIPPQSLLILSPPAPEK